MSHDFRLNFLSSCNSITIFSTNGRCENVIESQTNLVNYDEWQVIPYIDN